MLETAHRKRPLNLALLGTRGIPARYGGFETFAQELSTRLVLRGHRVTVYGRRHFVDRRLRAYRGVDILSLPSVRTKYLETVTHTSLSVLHALTRPYDLLLVCNAANAFLCWLPGLVGQKVVLNVDGIERLRKKWKAPGKVFYRLSEFLATVLSDCAVSDALSIQEYYRKEHGVLTRFIPYGAPVERSSSAETVRQLGLVPGRYLLYVSRLEPENNAHLVIQAHLQSGVDLPLVVVGDAPYGRTYISRLKNLSRGGRVLLPGAIYGEGYRELLSHCLCYVHATEVGGTHPALIEAMGAACLVLVNETPENREVVDETGLFYPFNDMKSLIRLMRQVCARPQDYEPQRQKAQERVRRCYDWEQVTTEYEKLFYEVTGDSFHGH